MRDKRNAKYLDAFNAFVKALVPEGEMKYSTESESRILEIFSELERATVEQRMALNCHFWDHGWKKFHSLHVGDAKTVYLNRNPGKVPCIIGRPLHEFAAYHFPDGPDFDFMRFSYHGLPQVGVNELSDDRVWDLHREEYVELNDGTAIERSYWDEGFRGHDQDGGELPFEEGDGPVVRELMPGSFFVCSIGSYLNDTRFETHMRQILNNGEESDSFKGIFECLAEEKKKKPSDNATQSES